ncbi:hypothetical protein AB5I41_23570 [Sphingomonas sp. MMS24-JH45]
MFIGAFYTAGGTPTEAQLDAWVAGLSDKAAREITLNDYDARGALRRKTSYAAADADGEPIDERGLAAHRLRLRPGGAIAPPYGQFAERGASRLRRLGHVTASTDALGGTTRFAFADAAQQTIVTLASGLVRTSTYDRAGDLVGTWGGGTYATTGATSWI